MTQLDSDDGLESDRDASLRRYEEGSMVVLFAVAVVASKGNDGHDQTEKNNTYRKSFRRSLLSTDPTGQTKSPVVVVDIHLT